MKKQYWINTSSNFTCEGNHLAKNFGTHFVLYCDVFTKDNLYTYDNRSLHSFESENHAKSLGWEKVKNRTKAKKE